MVKEGREVRLEERGGEECESRFDELKVVVKVSE